MSRNIKVLCVVSFILVFFKVYKIITAVVDYEFMICLPNVLVNTENCVIEKCLMKYENIKRSQ